MAAPGSPLCQLAVVLLASLGLANPTASSRLSSLRGLISTRIPRQRFSPKAIRSQGPVTATGGGGGDDDRTRVYTAVTSDESNEGDGNNDGGSLGKGIAAAAPMLMDKLKEMFDEANVDLSELPEDVKGAFLAGRIGIEEVKNFLSALTNPVSKTLVQASKLMRSRFLNNPFFLNLLGIEIGVGLGATVLAQLQQRGSKFLEQFDFVCADLSIVVAANIALVTALSPAAALDAPGTGRLAMALAGLPAFVAQKGDFSLAQRASCALLKGTQFAVLGSAASAVGQGMAKALITMREKMNPADALGDKVQLAPILPTALNFGAYMFCSSNPRYQVVNALEQSVLPKLPGGLTQTVSSCAARVYNNYLGGITWIMWARWRGLQ